MSGFRLALLVVFQVVATVFASPTRGAAEPDDPNRLLEELAGRFTWAPIEEHATVVQIDLRGDPGGSWHLVPLDGGDVELRPGPAADAGFTCELDPETLIRLYRGEISGLTAAGKDDRVGESPLEILPGTAIPDNAPRSALGPVFHVLVHFFNRSEPERFKVGRDAARTLHGAQMVGLFFHPGFRSAWYSIQGDEQLGGEGDTTEYPQAFVFVRGQARMKLGHRWFAIGEGEVIYVPPGHLHAIRSSDGGEVEVVWLAWGDGA